MTAIKPSTVYYLEEVLEKKLIPGVTGYTALYNLCTVKVPAGDNKLGVKRELAKQTTSTTIKALHDGRPWNKIKGKIKVEGKELIRFLSINGLI